MIMRDRLSGREGGGTKSGGCGEDFEGGGAEGGVKDGVGAPRPGSDDQMGYMVAGDKIGEGGGCCGDGYRDPLVGRWSRSYKKDWIELRIVSTTWPRLSLGKGAGRTYPPKAIVDCRLGFSGMSAVPSDIHRHDTEDGSARVTVWTALEITGRHEELGLNLARRNKSAKAKK